MSITYTSTYHCDDDPGGILGEILHMGEEFEGPAQDALVGWTLRLGDGIDPAEAAKRLLVRYEAVASAAPTGACGELIRLLRETAQYSRGRLDAHLCRPEPAHRSRRRGGRKARQPG